LDALPAILKHVDAALTAIAEAQGAASFAEEYRRWEPSPEVAWATDRTARLPAVLRG
jgi:hypothetical protein